MWTCAQCATPNRGAARFCDACGAARGAPPTDELKYVTVLFSDIVDSTAMIAGLPPDAARLRFTPALDLMAGAVQAFGGMINQYLGDGIMAFFGAPLSQEDHALQACCAALRMHEQVRQLDPPASLRIGLASGPTLLSTGGDAAGAYMAFGATIHLASRLQASAEPCSTLCSIETMRLAGPAAALIALGPRIIRGLPKGQEVFELTAIDHGAARFGSAVARGLSPYVNRLHELAQLRAAAAVARTGPAVFAALAGEAGVGKSRLTWEFARTLGETDWQILQVEAVSYGASVPYRLVIALLRTCLGLDAGVEPAGRAETFLQGLGMPTLLAAALLSLLDLPLGEAEAAWQRLEPMQRRGTLQEATAHLLTALAARRPLLLVLEDLHWSDQESLRLLDLTAGAARFLMVLVTYRNGFDPGWTRIAPACIPLVPLSAEETDQLIHGAFPSFEPRLRQALAERSAGNPFFTEEIARAAMEDGLPVQAAPGRGAIPSSVQAVLAARIDRLTANDRHLLRAASTLGNRFPRAGLQAMARDRPPAAFDAQMARLREAGLLRPDAQRGTDEVFAHALIQEVAYQALPATRRHALHAEALAALKAIDAERIPEHAETLAYHAFQGEVWGEAVLHARRAGRRAASRSAYRDAAMFFEQAVTALEHLPLAADNLAQGIDLRFELRNALFPTSGIGRNLGHSQAAERLALQLGDRGRLGWATAFHARDLTLVGRPGEAMTVAARALGVAAGNEELLVVTNSYLALASYSLGNYARSAAIMQELIGQLEAGDPTARYGLPGPAAIYYRGWLAWALSRMGACDQAQQASLAMVARAEASGQPLLLTIAHLSHGFALAFAGRLTEARDALQRSLALCRQWEFFAWFTNIAACLGHVLARLGDTAAGIDLLRQAADRTRSSGILVHHASELAWLAEAHLLAGDVETALRVATEAVAVAVAHEELGNEALATATLAAALNATGAGRDAAGRYQAALNMARACGMGPLAAQCHAALAGDGEAVQA